MTQLQDMQQAPFVDAQRVKSLRQELISAYESFDAEAVGNAAVSIQSYIDNGGDIDYHIADETEDYQGTDPDKMADRYILRLLHDRHLDTDDDQTYIATGLTVEMHKLFHYHDLKAKYQDRLFLFRRGDFYEAYEEDAKVCEKELGVTIRNYSGYMLAAFPYYALDTYLPKLIRNNHRVAIADQLEAPSQIKKLVQRDYSQQAAPKKRNEPVQLELQFT